MKLNQFRAFGHDLPELLDRAGKLELLMRNRDLWLAFQAINTRWSTDIRFRRSRQLQGFGKVPERFAGTIGMAKDAIIRIVEKALEKGFDSKGAGVYFVTEKSDYKDFIRMFVVSDLFRNKANKERLEEVFSMLEENGAKDAIAKISLCVAMTRREYDREFGKYTWLGRVADIYRGMKRKPAASRLRATRNR